MPPSTPDAFIAQPPQEPSRRKIWPYIVGSVVLILLAAVFVLTHAGSSNPEPQTQITIPETTATTSPATTYASANFSNPEKVTIQGYSGKQEDPNMSPDGEYLFFDDHDDAGSPIYIYWAKRVDYKTFKFLGRVPGVNFEALEGVEDLAHNFYLVSPILLGQGGQTTIGHGVLSGTP
jgi:hypothetical protein